ncbi:unnamed protein product [Phytophthora fragariaefolia]|uniref:Unnamed protein product n=1 Tax=Phytophthora fragariaefolia TaxID=1490495 RepID=A0A9W7CQN8_9STRA|nr:unnamed protein product [Phytophthora fragariaefolia]
MQSTGGSNQNENTSPAQVKGGVASDLLDKSTAIAKTPSPPPSPLPSPQAPSPDPHFVNKSTSSQENDALQRLIRNINCGEQQKRIEKLQAELEKAHSRRLEADVDSSMMRASRNLDVTSDESSVSAGDPVRNYSSENILSSAPAIDRQSEAVKRAAANFMHLKSSEGQLLAHQRPSNPFDPKSPIKATDSSENAPSVAASKQTLLSGVSSSGYPAQFVVPGYTPQMYPAPVAPYPLFSPPIINPYGAGFPSPYFPGCQYPVAAPWFPASPSYPFYPSNNPPSEQVSKPSLQQQEEDIRRLERELEMQRIANEQQAEAKEFDRLHSRLQELQLEELKEQIQRRRDEKKRELDHEEWIAKQKRELVALRLQRAIQHSDEKTNELSTEFQVATAELYVPESGFAVFWDYAAGVPATVNELQVCPYSFCARILKVAAVSQSTAGGPRVPTSLGWTAFDIFKLAGEGELSLVCGSFKLPVKQSSIPDPSKTLVLPPTSNECGDIRIHIRLVHSGRMEEASRMVVDPESQSGT